MYRDEEEIREMYSDFEKGEISAWEMYQAFEDWDGDPIEVIG
jgi:hypothetical protein